MPHSRLRFYPSFGIPNETFSDEVHELFIVASQDLRERLGPGTSPSAFRVDDGTGRPARI